MKRPESLVVLAKAPLRGASKTRLGLEVGEDAAVCLAEAFLDDTLNLAKASELSVTVAFTPEGSREMFARRSPPPGLVSQVEGDLGVRITAALNAGLEDSQRAILIGSDTPHLPSATLAEAAAALRTVDMVIGPACDGGFYLIGFSGRRVPDGIFETVEWSTPSVFGAVMANAERTGLSVAVLQEVTDIDDAKSLQVAMEVARRSRTALRTRTVMAALGLETALVP